MPQRIQTGNADGVGATPLNIEADDRVRRRSLRHIPCTRPEACVRECRGASGLLGWARGMRRLRADVRRGVHALGATARTHLSDF